MTFIGIVVLGFAAWFMWDPVDLGRHFGQVIKGINDGKRD